MTAKLENEIEALKLENIALKKRLGDVEGANAVLSKRILGAIALIEGNFETRVIETLRKANQHNLRI